MSRVGDRTLVTRVRPPPPLVQLQDWERQQKELKNLKKAGRSKKQAEADAKKRGGKGRRGKGGPKQDAAGNTEVKVGQLVSLATPLALHTCEPDRADGCGACGPRLRELVLTLVCVSMLSA